VTRLLGLDVDGVSSRRDPKAVVRASAYRSLARAVSRDPHPNVILSATAAPGFRVHGTLAVAEGSIARLRTSATAPRAAALLRR
jgi:hypothetical protein